MKKNDVSKKVISSEEFKGKLKQAAIPDSISFSGSYEPAQNLGNGRWQYKGKTYKEEVIN
ncbi:MAG TPA: hypothetical protein DDW50_01740 [Firmicutes bacterium]|nr:hypothetical protein [Bacillota bacterium]